MSMQVETNYFGDNVSMTNMIGLFGVLLSFIGGAIGGLTATPKIAINIQLFADPLLFDFIIRALVGGLIGLGVKVAGDYIIYRIRVKREKKQDSQNTEPK